MHGRGRAVDPSRRPLRGLLKVTVKRYGRKQKSAARRPPIVLQTSNA